MTPSPIVRQANRRLGWAALLLGYAAYLATGESRVALLFALLSAGLLLNGLAMRLGYWTAKGMYQRRSHSAD